MALYEYSIEREQLMQAHRRIADGPMRVQRMLYAAYQLSATGVDIDAAKLPIAWVAESLEIVQRTRHMIDATRGSLRARQALQLQQLGGGRAVWPFDLLGRGALPYRLQRQASADGTFT